MLGNDKTKTKQTFCSLYLQQNFVLIIPEPKIHNELSSTLNLHCYILLADEDNIFEGHRVTT